MYFIIFFLDFKIFKINVSFLKISVSDFVGGGELLKLLQNYGPLPEELCRIYFAELVVIIGTMFYKFYII